MKTYSPVLTDRATSRRLRMDYDGPRVDPARLDFSEFHDLMHRPFTPECRSLPGGSRRHLALWREYQLAPRWRARLLCPLGRHQWWQGWSRQLGPCRVCNACGVLRER